MTLMYYLELSVNNFVILSGKTSTNAAEVMQ